MKKLLKDQTGTITKENGKTGSCSCSSGCRSEQVSISSGNMNFAIKYTSDKITFAHRWDHLMARLGVNRNQHRIEPGLYVMGNPTKEAPVFVSANYTLSFDALRSSLRDNDCYMLVLDTKGINVWCAAGKGTFGTDELVHRIEAVGLKDVVSHRTLIVPQLGATGVDAREVKVRSDLYNAHAAGKRFSGS
jgi:hypothetical protein